MMKYQTPRFEEVFGSFRDCDAHQLKAKLVEAAL
jgi:hypothetical protein